MASITGKNRDQGSNFSQETARATGDLTNRKYLCYLLFITFINTISKKTFITYKKQEAKFFCSESNRSQEWLLLQAKFETLGSNFSQETRKGLLAASHTKEILLLAFITHRLSMQIFIKIWYTENNIVKN